GIALLVGVTLEAGPRQGGQLRADVVIGKINAVVAQRSFLRGFIYFRTVSTLLPTFITDKRKQFARYGKRPQSGHGPFMNMTEGADRFKYRIIARLPALVLIIRTQFNH